MHYFSKLFTRKTTEELKTNETSPEAASTTTFSLFSAASLLATAVVVIGVSAFVVKNKPLLFTFREIC